MDTLEALKWRYAVKRFDPEKKLSNQSIERVKEALRLTPTSMGLQLMQFIFVESESTKEKLKPIAYNQPQIEEASHLILMCRKTAVHSSDIDSFIEHAADANDMDVADQPMQDYDKSLRVSLSFPEEQKKIWTENQVYIALGNIMTFCASEQIDACPMEGFDRLKLNKELNLEEQNLDAVVLLALGHRSEEDYRLNFKKVRRPLDDLFKTM